MICWLLSMALWWIGLIVVIRWLFFWASTYHQIIELIS